MKILAAYNIKGGVGKTSACVNLAYRAARDGARTLVWDLDPQGAATFYFRVRPMVKGRAKHLVRGKRELDLLVRGTDFVNLDLLPSDFTYRKMDSLLEEYRKPTRRLLKLLRPLSLEYDYVFLDCPPSITLLSENVFQAADALLVPLIPTPLSLRTFKQVTDFLVRHRLEHVNLLPFFSLADRRKAIHRDIMDSFPGQWPGIMKTAIPYRSEVEKMGVRRAPVDTFAAGSPPSLAYAALWREIQERVLDY